MNLEQITNKEKTLQNIALIFFNTSLEYIKEDTLLFYFSSIDSYDVQMNGKFYTKLIDIIYNRAN